MEYPTYLQSYGGYPYSPYPQSRFGQQQYTPQNVLGTQPIQGTMPNAPNIQSGFLCRPVTSREEALGVQVDYLSAGTIMPDLGHGMIYLKRFDSNTGLSNIFEFALVQPQSQEKIDIANTSSSPDYSETFLAFGEQLASVSDRIDALTEKVEQWRPKSAKKGAGEE